MNRKKLLLFLLFAFAPVMGAGLSIHFAPEGMAGAIVKGLLTSLCMFFPLIAVVLTQVICKEPVLQDIGISLRLNRWWLIGWLLIPVLAFAILGVSLLMPGAHWSPDNPMVQQAMAQMPEGIGLGGFIALTTLSGMFAGITLNALFAFGEEVAWRGWLPKLFEGKSLPVQSLIIGTIWGLWHFPLILNGHNYPQHPVAGVFMMVLLCILLTPLLLYFRQLSGSVIVPAILHGTFNGLVGMSNLLVQPANDLLIGGPGLAGMLVLMSADLVILALYARKNRFSNFSLGRSRS
ncbi:MAG: CPBP family intramembrane metalloprotease [Bacteroidales bacterium]|nr:CPBP family intramembrane metalloprotease [Bacteroidales bacterium]